MLAPWVINALQVVTILLFAPLVGGFIARVEAMIQMRHGPPLLQPYYDIAKLLRKETVLPGTAGPVFRAAPYVAFAAYATIPLLIPALTSYGLPLGYMGDFLAVGLILGLGSFAISLAAIDSGSPFAQLGSSRQRTFGALGEPTVLFVVFTIALLSHTDLPYAMAAVLKTSAAEIVRPAHLLAAAAFFMGVLAETGRIPLEGHSSTLELGMIDEARTLEHSGPGLAFLKWGSEVKQLVLYTILVNVLVVPWGTASTHDGGAVGIAIGLLLAKGLVTGLVVVAIDSAFAKLRLYKIPEFTVAGFMLAVLGVVFFVFEPSYGTAHLTVLGASASVIAVGALLLEFGMLRSQDVWEQLRLYGLGSALVAALAFITGAEGAGSAGALFALGAVTVGFKALAVPWGIRALLRRLDVPPRVPSVVGVPTAILLAIVLSGFAFFAFSGLDLGAPGALPGAAFAVAVAGLLVAFLLMIVRPHAPSQLMGFLLIENTVTLAALVVAPGLPLILALLLLFDVLIGVVVFGVLVQYLAVHRSAVETDVLDRLRG